MTLLQYILDRQEKYAVLRLDRERAIMSKQHGDLQDREDSLKETVNGDDDGLQRHQLSAAVLKQHDDAVAAAAAMGGYGMADDRGFVADNDHGGYAAALPNRHSSKNPMS
jgi:hypothetical protein